MALCPPLLVPETQNCSGRGACINENVCVCDDGWSGIGDFAYQAPTCAINIAAVRGLWSFVAICNAISVVFAVYYLRAKFRQKTLAKAAVLFGFIVAFNGTFMVATGLIRAISPERTVGSDVAVTITFAIGSAAFWSASHVFIYSFIALAIRQSKIYGSKEGQHRILWHMKVSLPISNAVSLIACLLPIGMLSVSNAEAMHALATSHYAILCLNEAAAGLWLTPSFIDHLLRDLDDVIAKQNNDKTVLLLRVKAKMEKFRTEFRKHVLSNTILSAFFAFWPFLQVAGSSYFLPFAWSSGALVSCLGMYLNLPVSGKTKSSSAEKEGTFFTPMSGTVTNTRKSINTAGGGSTMMLDHHSFVEAEPATNS